jgi:hypothetical protein
MRSRNASKTKAMAIRPNPMNINNFLSIPKYYPDPEYFLAQKQQKEYLVSRGGRRERRDGPQKRKS